MQTNIYFLLNVLAFSSFEELYYWSLCNLNLIVQGMLLISWIASNISFSPRRCFLFIVNLLYVLLNMCRRWNKRLIDWLIDWKWRQMEKNALFSTSCHPDSNYFKSPWRSSRKKTQETKIWIFYHVKTDFHAARHFLMVLPRVPFSVEFMLCGWKSCPALIKEEGEEENNLPL